MIKLLFVCTGNICRSPMAEAIMADLIKQHGVDDQIEVDSAGTIGYHSGELADERARRELASHGIDYAGSARQVTSQDLAEFDYILGMTQSHISQLRELAGQENQAKVHLLLDFADQAPVDEVPDPYYDDNFPYVYRLIRQGCEGILEHFKNTEEIHD